MGTDVVRDSDDGADVDDGGDREDVAQALLRELALEVGEADVAIVATILCGGARGDRFRVAPSSPTPSPTLQLALARIFATGALAFLAAHGTRPRTVLRRGRRKTGGLLDADVNVDDDGAPFRLRFSSAAVDFVARLCVHVMPLASPSSTTSSTTTSSSSPSSSSSIDGPSPRVAEAEARARAVAEQAALVHVRPPPATTSGDHVVYALFHENLERLGLSSTLQRALQGALRQASPLCALLVPDDPALRDVDVDAVVAPGAVRAFECLHGVVVAGWGRAPRSVWLAADRASLIASADAACALARRTLVALDAAQRLDLVAPVVALVVATASAWPADARARLLERRGVQTMDDRETAIAALRALADVATDLEALRARMAILRYGDDRFEEAQLVLALLRDTWLPHRDDVAASVRRLTGVVA
jgi:hypothetical protein